METFIFPGQYENLQKIGSIIEQAAKDAGLSDSAVYQVELAVDEACTNIIEHAYGGEGNGDIEVSYLIQEDGLKVVLRDRGRPFDPSKVPTPNLKRPIEELEPRGVGLYMMRKMMDEVYFEFSPEEGNTLVMVKRR